MQKEVRLPKNKQVGFSFCQKHGERERSMQQRIERV